MKNLILLLVLLYSASSMGANIQPRIKGQADTALSLITNLEVPNKQATKTGPNTYLNETGNKNLLANPSFESPLVGGVIPSWNFGALAPVLEISSTVIDGKQLALFNVAASTVLLTQTSTLYASAFALGGTQGLATCRINSTAALKMCTISNSVTSTSNCVDVNTDGKWGLYKLPVILGTGNNGVSIASTGAVTGTVYVDDCFLGAQSLTQDSAAIGPWTTYTPTFVGFGTPTSVAFKSRQNGQNLEVVGSFTTGTNTAVTASISLGHSGTNGNATIDTNNVTVGQVVGTGVTNATASSTYYGNLSVMAAVGGAIQLGHRSSTAVESTPATGNLIIGNSGFVSVNFSVPITQFSGSVSTYSSTNADTDWAACNFSTLAWQGLGTVTNTLKCKRQGGDLRINGGVTLGTVTTSEMQIPLPLWNGSALTIKSSVAVSTVAGSYYRAVTGTTTVKHGVLIMSPLLAYLGVSYPEYSISINPLTRQLGVNAFGSSEVVALDISVPIEQFQNSNLIIGSFKEIPTTIGSSGADIQSVYFGSGAACDASCTTGNCTICSQTGSKITTVSFATTGQYNVNGIDGTKYSCTTNGTNPGVGPAISFFDRSGSAASFARVRFFTTASAALNTSNNSVICIGIP